MTVCELIALLRQHDPEAEVYVVEDLETGQPFSARTMNPVSGISPAKSDHYGAAVLLELED